MTVKPLQLLAAVAEEKACGQAPALAPRPLLVCLSHLRWGFVYQRPQHLMSRMARRYDVLFFEEPLPADGATAYLDVFPQPSGVTVVTPRLPAGLDAAHTDASLRDLLDGYLRDNPHPELLLWYFTPMSLTFSEHLAPRVTIYDCMDELSAFHGAPPELVAREKQLLARADVVFTGGVSIWEAKRTQHANAHAMPSSVDIAHFGAARNGLAEPEDQASIAHPRLGFFGVIDERFDIALVEAVARQRPEWQWVILGPVVKIDPASLPQLPNIHYLGGKAYDQLPAYLSGWDVATMPFARNEATRFISPTKTPEYLAGGCPVVSTSITDVVRTYGNSEVVHIADEPASFIAAVEQALTQRQAPKQLRAAADEALEGMSWDNTWNAMMEQIQCLG
ncbi:glycosyltransferase family 1 protein [Pseudomonas sp. Marseille-Q5115]|uniref:glycosyltransferase family 1 protein n=1 Tax=Pseudomonas sp. Marseille-Q5115 TaxID=2866593 RepID=UPI001CE42636|nr:glycosyltransferase family 1 protein [Pseudomonas sp. Marseille-Q5115]